MPIYEYRCKRGHTFEVTQRMTEDALATCQTCSAPAQRVFHPIAVHFKGKGFYNTDYGTRKRSRELKDAAEGGSSKSGGEESSAKSETKSDSASEKSSTKSSESKPASSTATGTAKSD